MDFLDIWKRIKEETELKTLTGMATFLGTTQQYVSRKKSSNDFPIKWAFKIGQEYGLLTEWIITGKGQKHTNVIRESYNNEILEEVDRWLTEQIRKEPFRKDWFLGLLLDTFPNFKEWRNHGSKKSENNTDKQTKAA